MTACQLVWLVIAYFALLVLSCIVEALFNGKGPVGRAAEALFALLVVPWLALVALMDWIGNYLESRR